MTDGITIGEFARRCGVSRDAVRFYERERLMPRPRRTAAGYRLYGPAEEERLRFIRRAQSVGLTLEDITALIRLTKSTVPRSAARSPSACGSGSRRSTRRSPNTSPSGAT